MCRWRPLLAIALLLARVIHAQPAGAQALELDAARSHAAFEVKVLYLIGLHGEFGAVHGMLKVDDTQGLATVEATINTNAVRMRTRRYENWVKSNEFFDAQHFPQISFVSKPFPVAQLESGGTLSGTLTIRGLNKPADFSIAAPACTTALAGTCEIVASGTIRRSEFGMRSRRGALADKVDLSLSIVVQPKSP
jgi:polyisoprenoid-binding protein YceI